MSRLRSVICERFELSEIAVSHATTKSVPTTSERNKVGIPSTAWVQRVQRVNMSPKRLLVKDWNVQIMSAYCHAVPWHLLQADTPTTYGVLKINSLTHSLAPHKVWRVLMLRTSRNRSSELGFQDRRSVNTSILTSWKAGTFSNWNEKYIVITIVKKATHLRCIQ